MLEVKRMCRQNPTLFVVSVYLTFFLVQILDILHEPFFMIHGDVEIAWSLVPGPFVATPWNE